MDVCFFFLEARMQWICAVLAAVALCAVYARVHSAVLTAEDDKTFKKILRTRSNVLVVAAKDGKAASAFEKTLNEVAQGTEGLAAVVLVDCGSVFFELCPNAFYSISFIDSRA
eukprot:m.285403 g.285403  ORF g.285403 m.285403 type:complete len:113 (+) comp54969_c0_seq3:96-434(+)